ncbi:Shwachman-Bodian-diamond syndrome protein [Punctularia strigosozonata HHB-11173 SS5]|uniref:Shwachman-Bodian-diamond syndrome protein n=1 Tax=Punctularia strigosozonata (strain HHB-11173) TaxID=741275 RepID=UPI0004417BD5|nr:Shwachman-Bodian-diamond syndrome protein [Punctularia strigosozonata HHB-11173 SS5]EIN13151.1 Shwachman-Bodian-diamond syndrome protein [Punctularia strigosozonata HHB-11173 SS5]
MVIQQPVGQIKLTNVSIVRLKKGGKRFEIACYKNKVQEWRNGVEKNLDDVLQIGNIFVNVSKGEVAKNNDLQKAFGTTDRDEIVKQILQKGEVQVGEKEREHDLSSLRREIATLVAEKCVDPTTQRPYPSGIIEKAMTEAGFSVKQDKSAKSQVGACLKAIQAGSALPIQRARMRVRVSVPAKEAGEGEGSLKSKVLEGAEKVESEETGADGWDVVMLIDPGQFRVINELLQKHCKGKGRIETLTFAATSTTS